MSCPLGLTPGECDCPSKTCAACMRARAIGVLYDMQRLQDENVKLRAIIASHKPRSLLDLPKSLISIFFTVMLVGAFIH